MKDRYIVMAMAQDFGFELTRFDTEQEAIIFANWLDWEYIDQYDFHWGIEIIER